MVEHRDLWSVEYLKMLKVCATTVFRNVKMEVPIKSITKNV